MPEDEAKYHMKRCVDSGLWVPEKALEGEGEEEEEVAYETVPNNENLDLD